jgi:hypothetical protein
MRRYNAILLLGLAFWTEPASAQEIIVHPLKVRIHPAVNPPLSQSEVEGILKAASNILQSNNHSCKVEFKLNGPIKPFTSGPAVIKTESDLEAVHRVPADVKVVQSIQFCVGEFKKVGFLGCAWRPKGRPKTVIVSREGSDLGDGRGPVVWAHEYGHTTGLMHRYQTKNLNLMTPCELEAFNREVNRAECDHFRAGPVSHYPPGLGNKCPRP